MLDTSTAWVLSINKDDGFAGEWTSCDLLLARAWGIGGRVVDVNREVAIDLWEREGQNLDGP
jgi:hypothetical protein